MSNELSKLLRLPKHLQTTFLALSSIGRASATMVSEVTKRARAVESLYLNGLVTLNYVARSNDGRIVYFTANKLFEPIVNELAFLSQDEQEILMEDMATALENRLKVFRRLHDGRS